MLTATLRPIGATDWPGVVALEAAAYRDLGLSEDPGHLRSRAGAGTSFVVETGGQIAGYLLAFPSPYGRYPDLTADGTAVPGSSDLHLHDLVIAPEHRRDGLGSRLVEHLLEEARTVPYARVSLVAVGGSRAFWTRHGFRVRPEVPVSHGYGIGAAYMSRPL